MCNNLPLKSISLLQGLKDFPAMLVQNFCGSLSLPARAITQSPHTYFIISYEEVYAAQTVKCCGNSLELDLQRFYLSAGANLALASHEDVDSLYSQGWFCCVYTKNSPNKVSIIPHMLSMLQQKTHSYPLLENKTHSRTQRALLVLPDKSLSTDQCLCTSDGAEGEKN